MEQQQDIFRIRLKICWAVVEPRFWLEDYQVENSSLDSDHKHTTSWWQICYFYLMLISSILSQSTSFACHCYKLRLGKCDSTKSVLLNYYTR